VIVRGRQAGSGCAALLVALSLVTACAGTPGTRPSVQHYTREGSRAPFSPAVRVGDVLYLSGQIGAREDGSLPDDIAGQTRLALQHVEAALALAGARLDDVFKCTAMLDDMSQWAEFNRAYLEYFAPGRLPARSSFGADGLALGALVEIECMAHAPPAR
jgi:enamine deaminase RidA (YjgF/YER057c/UK114 family)